MWPFSLSSPQHLLCNACIWVIFRKPWSSMKVFKWAKNFQNWSRIGSAAPLSKFFDGDWWKIAPVTMGTRSSTTRSSEPCSTSTLRGKEPIGEATYNTSTHTVVKNLWKKVVKHIVVKSLSEKTPTGSWLYGKEPEETPGEAICWIKITW